MNSPRKASRAAVSPRHALREAQGLARGARLTVRPGPPAIDQVDGVLYLPEDLPEHVPDERVAEHFVDLLRCWVMHEAGGHGRYTQPRILVDNMDELRKQPLLKSIWNAIEDGFIEASVMAEFRGARPVLDRGSSLMSDLDLIRTGSGGPSDVVITFLCAWTRVHWLDQGFLQDRLDAIEPTFRDQVGDGVADRVIGILEEARDHVASSEDSLAYARRVLDELVAASQAQPEDEEESDDGDSGSDDADEEGTGDGDSESADADDDGAGDDEDSDSDGDTGDGESDSDDADDDDAGDGGSDSEDSGDEDAEDGGSGSSSSDEDGDDDEAGDGNGEADSTDSGDDDTGDGGSASEEAGEGDTDSSDQRPSTNPEGAQQVLDDGQAAGEQDAGDPVVEALRALVGEVEAQGYGPGAGSDAGDDSSIRAVASRPEVLEALQTEVDQPVARLRASLREVLRAREISRRAVGSSGYRLDPRRLARSRVGDPNIWRTRRKRRDGTASVLVLLDLSGSMGGVIEQVTRVGLAFAEALEDLEVHHAITGFGSPYGFQQGGIVRVKGFGEDRSTHTRFGGLPDAHGGGTPLGAAMDTLIPYLRSQRADRQVMLTITDGMPHDLDRVHQLVDEHRRDVEMRAIGLGIDPAGLQMDSMSVASVEELAERLFEFAHQFAA